MLTRKQHELLNFIEQRLQSSGVSPSFDEMKDALGLKSKSGIHRLIKALEERGFIRRLPHRARALEVLRLPDSTTADATDESIDDLMENPRNPMVVDGFRPDQPARTGFAPNVIPGNFPGPARDETSSPNENSDVVAATTEIVPLPLYGRIAAGTPIEALRDHSNQIDVPASMLAGGDHYALEIAGDSMIEAGIHDGDTVIIRKCDNAENGSIVVALIEDHEATLKRLRKKGDSIALEPANREYETRIFGPDQVKVQGQLVGLLRKY